MIQGMSIDTARSYLKVMGEIEEIVHKIHAYAYLMSVFLEIDEGTIEIQSLVIGYIGKMIADDVLRIIEYLDDHFASRTEVELELEAMENDK
jgi:hypothetical protein